MPLLMQGGEGAFFTKLLRFKKKAKPETLGNDDEVSYLFL